MPESTPFARFASDPLTGAAAADGAIAGTAILKSALKIDPQVLHAVEFSTAQDLHGLADFHTYAQDHFFSAPAETAEGWFNRLTGYVAEQKAATAFEQAGHHVVFASVSNQPVWDMLVDGHPVQIKENLGAIKDFAVAHPDIPVYTDPHIADALHINSVHGLSVLDKDSIHTATTNTVDGLDGSFDPGFHFPVVTLAFSAYREMKLLFDEKTTFDRALIHVSMDVVGVGGGALLGGKLGALIGSIIPGPGTIIGGIIGSIAGGITGKFASTGTRRLPFYGARDLYNSSVEQARTEIDARINRSRTKVQSLQKEYQSRFDQFRSQVESSAKEEIGALEQEYEGKLVEMYRRFPEFLDDLAAQLRTEEVGVLAGMPRPGMLRFFFPDEDYLQRCAVRSWFRRARSIVKEHARTFEQLEPKNLETLHPAAQAILKEFVFNLDSLEAELAQMASLQDMQRKQAEEIQRQAVSQIDEQRQSLIREFGSKSATCRKGLWG